MAKERLKSPRARLFVALDLPDRVREEIAAWGRRELADPALRPTAPEALHVTLVFLGYRPEKEIGRIGEVVRSLEPQPLEIALGSPEQRPRRGRARFFALPVESPALVAMQSDLEEKLVSARLHEPERRRFWPHLTVARVRPEGKGSRRPRPVSKPPGALPGALTPPIGAVRVALYRSELKPHGARYTRLTHVDLR
jgi:RNA 2',3'-cyclic 3'-phosphodiesterase